MGKSSTSNRGLWSELLSDGDFACGTGSGRSFRQDRRCGPASAVVALEAGDGQDLRAGGNSLPVNRRLRRAALVSCAWHSVGVQAAGPGCDRGLMATDRPHGFRLVTWRNLQDGAHVPGQCPAKGLPGAVVLG